MDMGVTAPNTWSNLKMINLNRSGIYLVNPNGKKLRPLDLDSRRINKVAKVNCEYIKCNPVFCVISRK